MWGQSQAELRALTESSIHVTSPSAPPVMRVCSENSFAQHHRESTHQQDQSLFNFLNPHTVPAVDYLFGKIIPVYNGELQVQVKPDRRKIQYHLPLTAAVLLVDRIGHPTITIHFCQKSTKNPDRNKTGVSGRGAELKSKYEGRGPPTRFQKNILYIERDP